jgi:hypothetical protein
MSAQRNLGSFCGLPLSPRQCDQQGWLSDWRCSISGSGASRWVSGRKLIKVKPLLGCGLTEVFPTACVLNIYWARFGGLGVPCSFVHWPDGLDTEFVTGTWIRLPLRWKELSGA